jgi:hypothetical protein
MATATASLRSPDPREHEKIVAKNRTRVGYPTKRPCSTHDDRVEEFVSSSLERATRR